MSKNRTLARRVIRLCTLGLVLMAGTTAMTSCIDEDLSDCGITYTISYQYNLRHHLTEELEECLKENREKEIRTALHQALAPVYATKGQQLHLLFYTDQQVYKQENYTLEGEGKTLQPYLQPNDYVHIALGNEKAEPQIAAHGTERLDQLSLEAVASDTLTTQSHGLYAARLPILRDDTTRHYRVNLFPQNASFALVIDDRNLQPEMIRTYASGFATAYTPSDSTFHHNRKYTVRTAAVTTPGYHAFHATTFPSRDALTLRYPAQRDAEQEYWKMEVQVKLNGKYTKTTLAVNKPLRAGDLHIIKAHLRDDGAITTTDNQVGVSIELDWKPGGDHDIEI